MIKSESQGRLVSCGDTEALSNSMKSILNSQRVQKELSIGAKEKAEDFIPKRVFLEWEEYVCGKMLMNGKKKYEV